jgi:hypothetical protein
VRAVRRDGQGCHHVIRKRLSPVVVATTRVRGVDKLGAVTESSTTAWRGLGVAIGTVVGGGGGTA